jgi:hypothetical protein
VSRKDGVDVFTQGLYVVLIPFDDLKVVCNVLCVGHSMGLGQDDFMTPARKGAGYFQDSDGRSGQETPFRVHFERTDYEQPSHVLLNDLDERVTDVRTGYTE